MAASDWFLSASERRNPPTRLDRRHADEQAWSTGNAATPLVHGVTYFAELVGCLAELRRGDLVDHPVGRRSLRSWRFPLRGEDDSFCYRLKAAG